MRFQKGFTLLELLVVMVIIALFAGLIMLTVTPNDNKSLEREAKRLIHVIQLAQDEAIFQGIELGLNVQTDKYTFMRLQDHSWLPLASDREFKEYRINPAALISVEIENENIVKSQDEESPLPAIMILSSGELTNFKITLFLHC